MKLLDRLLTFVLALGALGHTIGTFVLVEIGSPLFVWSLSGALAVWMLVALHALRSRRPEDRAVAGIATLGSVAWAVVALLFGASIGNVADPRALVHAVAALGLAVLGAIGLFARATPASRPAIVS